MHRAALTAWAEGDWRGAAQGLDQLLVRWPADLLALLVGHQLDFFLGDAGNLRDRIARSCAALPASTPTRASCWACWRSGWRRPAATTQAEDAGLAALERNPDDVWATHAVVHTYEMRGRVDDGLRFLRTREADWSRDNLFTVHNWWHLALFVLEAGTPEEALAVYDRHLHNAGVGRRPPRDARRQRPAVAPPPRRPRQRRPFRGAGRGVVGAHGRRPLVRLQRRPCGDGAGRRRPLRRRPRRRRPARPLRGRAGRSGAGPGDQPVDDQRGRPSRRSGGAGVRRGPTTTT